MSYKDRDITADPEAMEELQQLRAMTTPVIVIDGQTIIGFDREKIDSAIAGGGDV